MLTPVIKELGNIYRLANAMDEYLLNYSLYQMLEMAFKEGQSHIPSLKQFILQKSNDANGKLMQKSLDNIRSIINNQDDLNHDKKSYILYADGKQILFSQERQRDSDRSKQSDLHRGYNRAVNKTYNDNDASNIIKEKIPAAPKDVCNYTKLLKILR